MSSSFDLFGSACFLMHCNQSATIKLGSESEKILSQELKKKGWIDIKTILGDNSGKVQTTIEEDVFFKLLKDNNRFFGHKVKIANKGIEVDFFIFVNGTLLIFELKSSASFDTSKAPAEVNTLYKLALYLQRKINVFDQPIVVKPYFCVLDEKSSDNIISGMKKSIVDNSCFQQSETLRSNVSRLIKAEVFEEYNDFYSFMSDLLKKEDDSINGVKITLGSDNAELKQMFVQPMTGRQFCLLCGIDYDSLLKKRLFAMKQISINTIISKSILEDDDYFNTMLSLRAMNDFSCKDFIEQLSSDFEDVKSRYFSACLEPSFFFFDFLNENNLIVEYEKYYDFLFLYSKERYNKIVAIINSVKVNDQAFKNKMPKNKIEVLLYILLSLDSDTLNNIDENVCKFGIILHNYIFGLNYQFENFEFEYFKSLSQKKINILKGLSLSEILKFSFSLTNKDIDKLFKTTDFKKSDKLIHFI